MLPGSATAYPVASPAERRCDTNAEDGEGSRPSSNAGSAEPEGSALPQNGANRTGSKRSSGEGGGIPNLHIREVRQGHKPGERFVRVHRPFHDTFVEAASDTLVARERVFAPRGGPASRMYGQVRRWVIGRPLASSQLAHERLPKSKALAVFASDALSSSSYATEEVLRILILGGALGLIFTLPVALFIGLLLAIVVVSYRQTIQ